MLISVGGELAKIKRKGTNQTMQLQVNEQYTGFDLAHILEGDQGTYLAQQSGQNFVCVAANGHSIKSLRPVGRRINELSIASGSSPEQWVVTKLSDQDISQELDAAGQRSKAAGR